MRVYACMHVYFQKGYKYSKYCLHLHSHTGTVAQFTSLDQRDGGSRPENVKGVLHSIQHLFGCWLHGCVSLCWQAVPPSPLGQEYLRKKYIRAIYVHIRAYTSHICMYIARMIVRIYVYACIHVYVCIACICMYASICMYACICMYMYV